MLAATGVTPEVAQAKSPRRGAFNPEDSKVSEEIHELHEHAEAGAHHAGLAPVTITMAILAVVVAAVTLLGHRAHTEEVLEQTHATDQWAYFQAKNGRMHAYEMFLDELSVFSVPNASAVTQVKEKYEKEVDRYREEKSEIEKQAHEAEAEVKLAQRRANRFDLAEVMLEAALVISSITLLTKKRLFWLMGMAFGLAGIAVGVLGLLVS